jgi:hypothetical protein
VVAGEAASPSLEIRKYEDWICSFRWLPYEVGQREVVFAKAADEENRRFWLRSAGAEGEFAIVDDLVIVHGYYLEDLPDASSYGLYGYAVPLETILDAVRGLRECFVFEPGEAWALPRRVCSKVDLRDFRERSPCTDASSKRRFNMPAGSLPEATSADDDVAQCPSRPRATASNWCGRWTPLAMKPKKPSARTTSTSAGSSLARVR